MFAVGWLSNSLPFCQLVSGRLFSHMTLLIFFAASTPARVVAAGRLLDAHGGAGDLLAVDVERHPISLRSVRAGDVRPAEAGNPLLGAQQDLFAIDVDRQGRLAVGIDEDAG